jgi:hypothetical protein
MDLTSDSVLTGRSRWRRHDAGRPADRAASGSAARARHSWTQVYPVGAAMANREDQEFPGDWPPGLLVLLLPELFGGEEDLDQKQLEVTVMTMADAGLIGIYLAHGWDGFLFGRLRLVSERGPDDVPRPPEAGTPWLWQEILDSIGRHETTWFGYRLHQLRDQTRLAAQARGIIRDDHHRGRLHGGHTVNAEYRAAAEPAARALARRWGEFIAAHPALHEELTEATRSHEAAIG